MKIWICQPAYKYGEVKKHYTDLPNLEARLDELDIPNLAELWGWDNYYVSDDSQYELAKLVVSDCISQFSGSIDYIIFARSYIPDGFVENNDRLKDLLEYNNLTNIPVTGVSLTGCNSLLSAIAMAQGLLKGALASNILIIAEEKSSSEASRLDQHCIFSDAACAFVLSSSVISNLEMLGVETFFCPNSEDSKDNIFRADTKKIWSAYAKIISDHGVSEFDISSIISASFYPPVLHILFESVGIPNGKRFRGHESKKGHAFSCDYLINLMSYLSLSEDKEENILMFSYADMHYGFCLIKRKDIVT